MNAAKLYLLDVEGTVAPLTLTTEVLFPYARKHFEEFLNANCTKTSVLQDLMLLKQENRAESEPDAPKISPVESTDALWPNPRITGPFALQYLLWLMDRDRKSTALKSLQGKIWKDGFESGELKGTVFPDVPPALERWAAHAKVAIYSSGSVEAQKLFFRFSSHGDLSPLISGYFDTRTGAKRESASYAAIASAMQTSPGHATFFSDAVAELDAAREAGFQTCLVIRPGNLPFDDAHGHSSLESFALL